MRRVLLLLLPLLLAMPAQSAVVRLAPDFSFPGVGKNSSLRSLRGQGVVLLIARSPKEGDYRKQLKNLREIYQQFASKQVVFIAAFVEGGGPVQSNIPFAVANNGAAVAQAFGVTEDFTIAIIGPDGNVDYQTTKVLPAARVRDVIQNSFTVQTSARKQ